MSLTDVIGVVFVVLKLAGVVTWPWLWVLSPFWFPFVVLFVLVAVGLSQ